MLGQFAENGFAVIDGVLSAEQRREVVACLASLTQESPSPAQGGIRNLLDRVPGVLQLAQSLPVRQLVETVLGPQAFPVRGILFDKTPQANWKVPWHQDLTIAVQEKSEAAGFGPWTLKDGVHHVQAPREVLEQMLAVRIHLDDCGEENGPLRMIPGSHRQGRLSASQIQGAQQSGTSVTCLVGAGGLILMRPLLLHASSAAKSPAHRRVIHIEFAACQLPDGLRWFVEPAILKA
jgi:ectoine hydroxylase-related dioxygenase (phytanoyl-CoA dioxygenase family)